ncbi:MAG TPA: helix-turn-helix domain-containing protein [Nocardioidaceae bacterium]
MDTGTPAAQPLQATEPKKVRLDERALRVLAHPLRTRLLSLLRADGPATATTLARALDTNTGATSYHLRKLAEVGLVEETADGRGRERWWRAAHDMHSWSVSDFVGQPDAEAAREWLEGEYFRSFTEHMERWVAEAADWPLEWRDAAGASDYILRLTPAELREMSSEIYALLERYRTLGASRSGADEADGDRRRVLFYMHAIPQAEDHGRRAGR